jgi:hypothetical protein
VLFFVINGFRILRTLYAVSAAQQANARWKRVRRVRYYTVLQCANL